MCGFCIIVEVARANAHSLHLQPVRQLAQPRVAPTGSVLATDLDTTVLEQIEHPNLEVREHDLLADELARSRGRSRARASASSRSCNCTTR